MGGGAGGVPMGITLPTEPRPLGVLASLLGWTLYGHAF